MTQPNAQIIDIDGTPLSIDDDGTAHALDPAQTSGDTTLDLVAYSDGQTWDDVLVAEEVNHHIGRAMREMFEVGKRLVWAKETLGHKRFGEWRERHIPLSDRTCTRYMQLATFLVAHPKAIGVVNKAGLKKSLELISHLRELDTDRDLVDEMLAEGEIPGVDLKRLDDLSYNQLKADLLKARRDLALESRRLTKAERELQDAKLTIADGAMHTLREEEELVAELDEIWDTFSTELKKLHPRLMKYGRHYADLPPDLAARFRAMLQAMQYHITNEAMVCEEEAGVEHFTIGHAHHFYESAASTGFPIDEGTRLRVLPVDFQPGDED